MNDLKIKLLEYIRQYTNAQPLNYELAGYVLRVGPATLRRATGELVAEGRLRQTAQQPNLVESLAKEFVWQTGKTDLKAFVDWSKSR